MFTVSLLEFKTNQTELHRRGTYFRLVKLLKNSINGLPCYSPQLANHLLSLEQGLSTIIK
jgi:hypothetical protein